MPTIFEKIVSGEIPCHKVGETENYLAFLDVFPLKKGHTLVIPKKPVDYIFDMENESFVGLQLFAKIIAEGIKKAIPCNRVGVAIIGLEVPHAHIHLIPIDKVSDMDFSKKMTMSQEELASTAADIRKKLLDSGNSGN
jgi:histidine triad (HIT) family protein